MKIHPLKLKNFKGRVHYEKEHLVIEEFSGKNRTLRSQNQFALLPREDESIKRDNLFSFQSMFLDIDELINYNPLPSEEPLENHDSIQHLRAPFTDMSFSVDIKEVNYHQHSCLIFTQKCAPHPITFYTSIHFQHQLQEGRLLQKGYFNGSNPDLIYFSPDMHINKIDLDQVLLKFDNRSRPFSFGKSTRRIYRQHHG